MGRDRAGEDVGRARGRIAAMNTNRNNPIIAALDVRSAAMAVELATKLSGSVGSYKVGLELFNAEGPSVFDRVRDAAGGEARIFYDAKLHDIPNTVAGAVRAARRNNLWMINIHASGGAAMLRAAVDAAHSGPEQSPLVIAVTVLTSIDTAALNSELGMPGDARDQVVRLALLAKRCGCDGVVASPHEVGAIRSECGSGFLIVTPGVRPAGAELGDQKRVMTPSEAVSAGADYLVIGRPITGAPDPVAAAQAILSEIAGLS